MIYDPYSRFGLCFHENQLGQSPIGTNACFCTGKDASGMCRCEKMQKYRSLATPKPKLTTVWEGDSLDILARESIEGLTKHQPKGK